MFQIEYCVMAHHCLFDSLAWEGGGEGGEGGGLDFSVKIIVWGALNK